jgi:hypothetical protein
VEGVRPGTTFAGAIGIGIFFFASTFSACALGQAGQTTLWVRPVCDASLTIKDEVALPGAVGIFSGKRASRGLAVF